MHYYKVEIISSINGVNNYKRIWRSREFPMSIFCMIILFPGGRLFRSGSRSGSSWRPSRIGRLSRSRMCLSWRRAGWRLRLLRSSRRLGHSRPRIIGSWSSIRISRANLVRFRSWIKGRRRMASVRPRFRQRFCSRRIFTMRSTNFDILLTHIYFYEENSNSYYILNNQSFATSFVLLTCLLVVGSCQSFWIFGSWLLFAFFSSSQTIRLHYQTITDSASGLISLF